MTPQPNFRERAAKNFLESAGSWIFPVIFVLGILLFTPIGGVVKAIIFFVWLLGGGALIIRIFFAVLNTYHDYASKEHWQGIGLMVGGLIALTGLMIIFTLVLPDPSISSSNTSWDGRGNPRGY